MPFLIDDMRSSISKGVARPAHYVVDFQLPPGLQGNNGAVSRCITLCEETQLPGRLFVTTDHILYGVTRKMPYGVQYEPLPMKFICTEDMEQRALFESWHSLMSNPVNNYFNYFDNYVTKIYITKLTCQNEPAYMHVLEEAYPISIEAQNLSYSAFDQYLTLETNFTFTRAYSLDAAKLNGIDLGSFPDIKRINIPGILDVATGIVGNIPLPPESFNLSNLSGIINTIGDPLGIDLDSVISNLRSNYEGIRNAYDRAKNAVDRVRNIF